MPPLGIAARLTAERAMWFACTKHARSVVGRPLFSSVRSRLQRRWLARASAAAARPDGPRSELGRSSSRLRLVLLQLPQLPRSRFSHLGGSRAPLRAWVVVQLRRARVGRRSARGSTETRPRGGGCFVLGFVIMAREFCQTRESSPKAPPNSAVFSNLNQVQVEDAPPSWRRTEPIPVCLTP